MLSLLQSIVSDTTTVLNNVAGTAKCSWFEWKVTVGDVLTFLGIAIAIYEYWRNSKESREQALSSQKETWFLNVIVLPQLDSINKFYQDLIIRIVDDKGIVECFRKEDFDQCLVDVAGLKKQRKDEINDFFDHIVALVMSYDENLGRDINDIVMALEDIYVKAIDGYVKDEKVDNIRAQFLQHKQQLIAKLNTGLKK